MHKQIKLDKINSYSMLKKNNCISNNILSKLLKFSALIPHRYKTSIHTLIHIYLNLSFFKYTFEINAAWL